MNPSDRRHENWSLLYSTVRLETTDSAGQVGSATGFFFSTAEEQPREFLITNKHVLEDAERVRLRIHLGSRDRHDSAPGGQAEIEIPEPGQVWRPHPDSGIDLGAVPVTWLQDYLAGEQRDCPFFVPWSEASIPSSEQESRFATVMQVLMIGYPRGLWDERNNMPLVRRDTTASHPAIDFNGHSVIVVDVAAFPGSSGSPVVLWDPPFSGNSYRLLGTLYAGPTLTLDGEVVEEELSVSFPSTSSSNGLT